MRIDTRGLSNPSEQRRVGALLAQKLSENGMSAGNNAAITLVATVKESPQKKEVSYGRGFSPSGRGVQFKVREFTSKLAFVCQGKPAWEQSGTNIPGSVSLKDGESMDEALRRHEKPNYAWFDRVELPVVLRKPTGQDTLGKTKVTETGLQ